MTPELSPRVQRFSAIGLLGLVLGSLWLGIGAPIANYAGERTDARAISLRALRRGLALIKEEPAVDAAVASVGQSRRWQNFYENPKPEAATLQLETELRAMFRPS